VSPLICGEALGIDEFIPQGFKVRLIQCKFELEGAIGDASLALE
jgi:hypothetical protein